jgi:hypothetical protein
MSLLQKLKALTNTVKIGSIHEGIDGKYKIHGVALSENDETPVVYYTKLYRNTFQISTFETNFTPLKLTYEQKLKIKEAKNLPKTDDFYYHYRNLRKMYKIIGTGYDHNIDNIRVIYEATDIDKLIWVRDLSVWNQTIYGIPRFVKVQTFRETLFVIFIIAGFLVLLCC